eukprot:1157958-Pelagomonas_calceolata.AAC.3
MAHPQAHPQAPSWVLTHTGSTGSAHTGSTGSSPHRVSDRVSPVRIHRIHRVSPHKIHRVITHTGSTGSSPHRVSHRVSPVRIHRIHRISPHKIHRVSPHNSTGSALTQDPQGQPCRAPHRHNAHVMQGARSPIKGPLPRVSHRARDRLTQSARTGPLKGSLTGSGAGFCGTSCCELKSELRKHAGCVPLWHVEKANKPRSVPDQSRASSTTKQGDLAQL